MSKQKLLTINLPSYWSTLAPNSKLRVTDVMKILGVSKLTIYDWQKSGRFPMPDGYAPMRGFGKEVGVYNKSTIVKWIKDYKQGLLDSSI